MKNICLTLLLTMFCGISICSAQKDNPTDPFLQKGNLIYETTAPVSDGEFEIKGYRLEQVDLTVEVRYGDEIIPSKKAFRIAIVFSKPLPFREYGIWINDRQMPVYADGKSNEAKIILHEKHCRTAPLSWDFHNTAAEEPKD